MAIDQEIGAYLCQHTSKRVNLSNPDLTIHIELLKETAYYAFNRELGPGGLPVGTGGKVVCLLSGGLILPSRPTA